MAFVHGHAREAGWVVSHYRRPQRSGQGQLDLDGPGEVPVPREPVEDGPADADADDGADDGAAGQSSA